MADAAVSSSGDASAEQVAKFVARWQASEAAERANYQLFLSELCGLLGVQQPEPTKADVSQNAYVFERDVTFQNPDGTTSIGRIDLYKRGCLLETTSPEEACDAYRAALELEPEFADAHVNLGRLLHEVGDVYAALVHYRAALSLRPGDTTAAFNVGVALEDLGATVDAITAYRRALECEPRNPDAHYNLARLLEQDGKPDLAVRHLLLYRQLTKKR